MDKHLITILIIILIGGLLGGFVNYLRIEKEKFNIIRLLKSFIYGICAALLVPVLFKLISSDLIISSETNSLDYLVIFGFSLVAGIFSINFIDNLGKKVLNIQDDLNETRRELDTLGTEPEEIGDSYRNFDFIISEDEFKVLETLVDSRYVFRAISKIAIELNKDKETLREHLRSLQKRNLVKLVEKQRGKKWMITDEGKEYYNYYIYEIGEESTYNPL